LACRNNRRSPGYPPLPRRQAEKDSAYHYTNEEDSKTLRR
jgi:hypothetical protein